MWVSRVSAACTVGVVAWWAMTAGAAPALAANVTGSVVLVSANGQPATKPDHSGAVVWLEPVGAAPRPASSPLKLAALDQRHKTFVPHVLAIEVGTAVDFPNRDPIFHNVFSNYDGQLFDIQLYAPRTSRRVVFRRVGMARVFCNIHEDMSAVIAVLATPYFAVTRADGRFEIQAPAGEYRIQFWHERSQPDLVKRLEQRVTIGDATLTLGDTRIVVSTESMVPHKDKYGHDYAQRASDHVFYPGARR